MLLYLIYDILYSKLFQGNGVFFFKVGYQEYIFYYLCGRIVERVVRGGYYVFFLNNSLFNFQMGQEVLICFLDVDFIFYFRIYLKMQNVVGREIKRKNENECVFK